MPMPELRVVDVVMKAGLPSDFRIIDSRLRAGDPYGTRTRVFAVRGRRPRPLDEGAFLEGDRHM